jgi:hypothetical protein
MRRIMAAAATVAFLAVAPVQAQLLLNSPTGGAEQPLPSPETAPILKVDLVVTASGYVNDDVSSTDLCVYLPMEASIVKVLRRPLVPETGSDRQLYMDIRPMVSTAFPLIERASIRGEMALTVPELGGETCFTFENRIFPREAQGVAQAYKHFAQIVSIEVR